MFRRKLRAQSDLSLVLGGRKSQRRGTATSPDQSNSSNNNNNSKGVLKYLSADESLKSVYGSERSSADVSGSSLKQRPKSSSSNRKSLGRSRSVIFTAIEIREYGRTVGDNPSCSSGPPMSYVILMEYVAESQATYMMDYNGSCCPHD